MNHLFLFFNVKRCVSKFTVELTTIGITKSFNEYKLNLLQKNSFLFSFLQNLHNGHGEKVRFII